MAASRVYPACATAPAVSVAVARGLQLTHGLSGRGGRSRMHAHAAHGDAGAALAGDLMDMRY